MLVNVPCFTSILKSNDFRMFWQTAVGEGHKFSPPTGKCFVIFRSQILLGEHKHVIAKEHFVQIRESAVINISNVESQNSRSHRGTDRFGDKFGHGDEARADHGRQEMPMCRALSSFHERRCPDLADRRREDHFGS